MISVIKKRNADISDLTTKANTIDRSPEVDTGTDSSSVTVCTENVQYQYGNRIESIQSKCTNTDVKGVQQMMV